MMESTAKLFKNGRSQAVRLPKAFRFKGSAVRIRKEGARVILEPLETSDWPSGFWDIFTPDPEFEIPKALPTKHIDLDEPSN
jgi:antitoxin VapB